MGAGGVSGWKIIRGSRVMLLQTDLTVFLLTLGNAKMDIEVQGRQMLSRRLRGTSLKPGQRKNLLLVLRPNPGPSACSNESQTQETVTGEKESDLFECRHLEKVGAVLS